jgi:hypothetical protein
MAKPKRSFLPHPKQRETSEWLWANKNFEEKYPALYEILAAGMFEGDVRKGATVTLFASDGRLKACVSDRHTHLALWITLEPFVDILAEIEVALTQEKPEWKPLNKNGATPTF